jgi:hypothetical protein
MLAVPWRFGPPSGTGGAQKGESLEWNPVSEVAADAIVINPAEQGQQILGFGAALTDGSCYVLSQLPESRIRDQACARQASSPSLGTRRNSQHDDEFLFDLRLHSVEICLNGRSYQCYRGLRTPLSFRTRYLKLPIPVLHISSNLSPFICLVRFSCSFVIFIRRRFRMVSQTQIPELKLSAHIYFYSGIRPSRQIMIYQH